MGEPDLDRIVGHFRRFTSSVAGLPLYARLTDGCLDDREVASLLLAARPGQARPVLLFAAVHDLVLRRPDLPLARWYPSITPESDRPVTDPWPDFRSTCLEHRDELTAVIASRTTQTNEVNRVVLLAPLLVAACHDVPEQPISFVELGTSAGLLLGFDRYRIDVGGVVVGEPSSSVRNAGSVRGAVAPPLDGFPPSVVDRRGIDLDPVLLDDVDRVRWLEACLWPDQPERLERFRAAVALLRDDPPPIVVGDFVDCLPAAVAELSPDTHLVVFDAWALTYVERARRETIVTTLESLAADGRAVSWVTAEPPGCVPGIEPPNGPGQDESGTQDTVLGLRRWRNGHAVSAEAVGWSHPHGAWLHWVVS